MSENTKQTISIPSPTGGSSLEVEVWLAQSEQFAARLKKVAKQRNRWASRNAIDCYRLYDADLPDYAAAIDLYRGVDAYEGQTFVHLAEYAPPAQVSPELARKRLEDMIALTPAVLGIPADRLFCKTRTKDKGGSQYRDAGGRAMRALTAEHGLVFEIDLGSYLDTGIFLDHRITREMVKEKSSGKRFLNLFAYTGTVSCHAAAGGALETVTVDLSNTYLDWARRNMERNGFSGNAHQFERADVIGWLVAALKARRQFDLVFVDPPTFSNSKAMGAQTWDVQRDHVAVLRAVKRLLAPGGEAIFSCNLRSFKLDYAALEADGIKIADITAETIPLDFERNPKIHQCFLLS